MIWRMESSYTSTSEKARSIGAAAHELGVSIATLRRWDNSGKIRAFRTAGGHRRYPVEEIRRIRNEQVPA